MNELSAGMLTEKQLVRKEIALKKKGYDFVTLSKLSDMLWAKLEGHPRFMEARCVLLYYSLPDEVQTHTFIEKWSKEKEIILPVVKGQELELRKYAGMAHLVEGSFHIGEPEGKAFTAWKDIGLAIIPGVSFDREGNRLGWGKGYYDRLLSKLDVYKIGICFGFQVSTVRLPVETSDTPMDEVWTESGCLT